MALYYLRFENRGFLAHNKITVMKKSLIFIIFLTLFSFGIRIYRITQPNHYYFDEVYHAVTAKAYADNNPAPYNPFSPPPKPGTAYDWLHPPLAKLIQAGSIKLLGDKPIGWRLPSVIFGTAIIPATFVLANILFGPTVAIFASVTIAFENLTFVMSRITMNDVFIVFFAIISFIFATLYGKQGKFRDFVLTAVFAGLALASKWTGLYAIAVVYSFILWNDFRHGKFHLGKILVLFIPVLIYLGAYGQYWIQGHTIKQFIDLHKQIWWYQNRHDLQHAYGTTPLYCVPQGLSGPKTWCPWILDIRPVYFSYEQYGAKAGYIYALGNPLIYWVGVIAVSYLLGKFIDERKKEIALVLLGYFIFWVPWIFSPRILFMYHYLPSNPFLSISIGVAAADLYKTKFKYLSILLIIIFAIVFFYFFPITSGLPIDISAIDKYMWLKSWR